MRTVLFSADFWLFTIVVFLFRLSEGSRQDLQNCLTLNGMICLFVKRSSGVACVTPEKHGDELSQNDLFNSFDSRGLGHDSRLIFSKHVTRIFATLSAPFLMHHEPACNTLLAGKYTLTVYKYSVFYA